MDDDTVGGDLLRLEAARKREVRHLILLGGVAISFLPLNY
jgi:hypothetical protein